MSSFSSHTYVRKNFEFTVEKRQKKRGRWGERKKEKSMYSIVSFENRIKYLIAIKTRNFIFPCTNTYRNHYSLYNISIIDRYSELHAIITREIYIKYHRNELQALNIHLFKQYNV